MAGRLRAGRKQAGRLEAGREGDRPGAGHFLYLFRIRDTVDWLTPRASAVLWVVL